MEILGMPRGGAVDFHKPVADGLPGWRERVADPLIGQALAMARDNLLALASDLRRRTEGPPAALIDQVAADLGDQAYRIAVIGQMKAGKSSLINALIKKPGLLPSNVNPWTGVVTRLHFGRPDAPESGMVFRFFSETEWQDRTTSGGLLGQILARVEPEAAVEELAREGRVIEERAGRQLGRLFRHLLDQEHHYATVSSKVLARYVCGGEVYQDSAYDFGRFADITKSADLYMSQAPFALPTVLIDTPGINDPFLMREQATSQALDEADIFLVVLNAEQALADTDLTLLRQLHGVHKDRVVLFVNRIDALNDTVADCAKVLDSVRRHLADEFPGADMPIIAGSAWWGEQSVNLDADRLRTVLEPNLLAYADHLNVLPMTEATRYIADPEPPMTTIQDVVWRCSGMAGVSEAISRLLAEQAGGLAMARGAAGLKEVAQRMETIARGEHQALRTLGEAAGGSVTSHSRQLQSIQQSVGRLEDLGRSLAEIGKAADEELALMVKVALEGLRNILDRHVAAFADAEAKALETAGLRKKMRRTWRCNIRPLRQTLGEQFLAAYRRLADDLLAMQNTISGRVHQLFDEAAPGYDLEITRSVPEPIDPSPSIAALGQVLALDFGAAWHKWLTLWREVGVRPERLRRLIISEFQIVIDGLIASARETLDDYVANVSGRFHAEIAQTMGLLRDRQRDLAGIYKGLLEDRNSRTSGRHEQDHQLRLDDCERRVADLVAKRQRMEDILRSLRGGGHLA